MRDINALQTLKLSVQPHHDGFNIIEEGNPQPVCFLHDEQLAHLFANSPALLLQARRIRTYGWGAVSAAHGAIGSRSTAKHDAAARERIPFVDACGTFDTVVSAATMGKA